jgi:ribosomal protein S27AE
MEQSSNNFSKGRIRNLLILGVVIVILLGILSYRVTSEPPKPPEGAKVVVICKSCKKRMIKRIVNIDNDSDKRNYCDKCGGRLAILWKCNECQFEFPEPKLEVKQRKFKSKAERYDVVMKSQRCPNCGSILSHPVTLSEFKKDQKKKK